MYPIVNDTIALTTFPPQPLAGDRLSAECESGVFLRRSGEVVNPIWVLLSTPGRRVSVNGRLSLLAMHILTDRDAIEFDGGEPIYFSTETLPRVEEYRGEGADEELCCPRCSLPIEPGQMAVRCPLDSVWHHDDRGIELPCWSNFDGCAIDPDHPTRMDGGFRWSPDDL